jgi:hypothetical protein
MTDSRTSHITVTYTLRGVETTCIYAVNTNILREVNRKKDREGKKLTGRPLADWLKYKGARLDCPDGPAIVQRFPGGGPTRTEYFREGIFVKSEIRGSCGDDLLRRRPAPKAPGAPGPA